MNYITVALAKGRLADTAVSLFEKLGYNVSEMKEKSRKLFIASSIALIALAKAFLE